MAIPSDIPVQVKTPPPGVLQALGLKPGMVISGEVTAITNSGTVQISVSGQQLNLVMPVLPQLGAILQFQVHAGGPQPQLLLLAQNPQSAPQAPIANPQAAVPLAAEGAALPQPPVQPASLLPAASHSPAGNAVAAAQPLGPPVPLSTSAQLALALNPGQYVTAEVLPAGANHQPRVMIGGHQVPLDLPHAPPPGTQLYFQAQAIGGRIQLVPLGEPPGQAPAALAAQMAQSQQPALHASALEVREALKPHQPPTAAAPVTPNPVQQVLAQASIASIPHQDSLGALIASLAGLQKSRVQLPEPILLAAQRLLAGRVNLEAGPLRGEALRAAIFRSGVFQEALLAQGVPVTAGGGDIKSLLLFLRAALGQWLGGKTEPLPPHRDRPHPPVKGAIPRAEFLGRSGLPEGVSQRDAGHQLLSQTDSALARLRLFQMASLPDHGPRVAGAPAAEWNLELPFLIGGETQIARLQISRDPDSEGEAGERGWAMAFSVRFGGLGEIGARVTLRARKTGVVLWAESDETAEVLEEMLPELEMGLRIQGLDPEVLRVRRGAPEAPLPRAGGFVDSLS